MSNLGNKQVMAKNIKRYLEINGLTQTDICKALGFKAPTFSRSISTPVKHPDMIPVGSINTIRAYA